MSVPVFLKWDAYEMPANGVYEVYSHTTQITDLSTVPNVATLIDELRGHTVGFAAPAEQNVYFYVRFRNDVTGDLGDWITGSITTGKNALRDVSAPLNRTNNIVGLSIDSGTLEVASSALKVKDVFAGKSQTALTDAPTDANEAHSLPDPFDADDVNAALDALGVKINAVANRLNAIIDVLQETEVSQ